MNELENPADTLVSGLAEDPDLADLVEEFVGELPARAQAIERACAEQDIDTLTRLAHQLKGSAGGYGFPAITEVAANLERNAKAREGLDKLTEGVREVIDLCSRARARPETGPGPEARQTIPDGNPVA